jgi:uncharacterized protein YndB with AHSA1/START domain
LHKEALMNPRARVEKRVVYPVGREEVWAAITRPEELSRWFGMEVVSLDLRPAGCIVFQDGGGTSRRALVEEVEPPCRFVFRWLPTPAGGPARDPGSRVDFFLEEVPGGTALTVVETPSLAVGEMIPMVGPVFLAGSMPDPVGAPPRIKVGVPPGRGMVEVPPGREWVPEFAPELARGWRQEMALSG